MSDALNQPVMESPTPPTGEAAHIDILASLRHSLRTPLNQILGYSELLLEDASGLMGEEFVTDLNKIHTAGGQLLSLITEAMAPWKAEEGTIDFDSMRVEMRTPLNLIIGYAELCEEVVEESGQPQLMGDLKKIVGSAKDLLTLSASVQLPSHLEIKVQGRPAAIESVTTFFRKSSAKSVNAARILVVDDNDLNRDMLGRRLERMGYTVMEATNGRHTLEILSTLTVDLILLDMIMPEMGGYETLEKLMADPMLKHIPVVMLSAMDEIDNVARCIENGADDYLTKPVNTVLLQARIRSSLDKKRLRDAERHFLEILQVERQKSDTLLNNMLPPAIAKRLKEGENKIAEKFPNATVLVADFHNFNLAANQFSPDETVEVLEEIFSQFDWLTELHGLEKIKSFVDSYVAVGGMHQGASSHMTAAAEMALEMQKVVMRFHTMRNFNFALRVGICHGTIMGGVFGRKRFFYDVWGDTVKVADLLQGSCEPGGIRVAANTQNLLQDRFLFKDAPELDTPFRGKIKSFYLLGRSGRTVANLAPGQPA
jgi:CheY-like chemotaxis protein/class 3 adenylate cyclase